MSSALKNRFVGTIIVVALVVIFLPELLDGEKRVSKDVFVDIPIAPPTEPLRNINELNVQDVIDSATRPIQLADDIAVDASGDTQNNNTDVSNALNGTSSTSSNSLAGQTQTSTSTGTDTPVSTIDANDDANAVDETTTPEPLIAVEDSGWVIQLGSFSDEANAKKLIRTLVNGGYRAYSRPIQTRLGVLIKVFVGPEIKRENLEAALPHLQEVTGLNGKITKFEVSAR